MKRSHQSFKQAAAGSSLPGRRGFSLTFAMPVVAMLQRATMVVGAAALLALLTRSAVAQPSITIQPVDISASLGANVTNSVTTDGIVPLGYQWWFKDAELLDATNRFLILTNLQPTAAGAYSVVVIDTNGSSTSRLAQVSVDATFTKITTGPIATDRSQTWGCGWGDFDNDGFIDLVVGGTGSSLMYKNNGDGTFSKLTNMVTIARGDATPLWADYDNDGFLDLFMPDANHSGTPHQKLFHNNGDGTFAVVTNSPLVADTGMSPNAAWGDYNNDGYLDLVLPNLNGAKSIYRNNGNGTFARMSSSQVGSLANDSGFAVCVAWADYDDDGKMDVLFTQEDSPNRLYHNNGDGTFQLVPATQFGKKTTASMGIAWEDFFNRGLLDLFIVNGGANYRENDFYFRNNGDGTFTSMTTNEVGSVVADASPGYGCAAADYDNDGYLDLFVANPGIGNPGKPETNLLYHNNGDGTFSRINLGSLTSDSANSISCAWGDYDNDGFMDLFVSNGAWGGYGGPQPAFLYRNNRNTNHWLTLKLVGTVSNRSGIGAKVRVKATLAGKSIWQLRHLASASGFTGQNDLRPHFGLRDATAAEIVRIEWPSGIVQEIQNVAANQFLTVTEPAKLEPSLIQTNTVVELTMKSWKGFVYGIEASRDLRSWTGISILTNETGRLSFSDPAGAGTAPRFYRAVSK